VVGPLNDHLQASL
jgi:hypothetical protein